MGRRLPDANLTLRIDPDVVLWARMRGLRSGTSVNRVIRGFLEDYAAVPRGWWEGEPPPWRDSAGDDEPADGASSPRQG